MKLCRYPLMILVLCHTSAAFAAGPDGVVTAPDGYDKTIKPFVEDHCASCHSGEKPEAGLNLTTLPADFSDAQTAKRWSNVREQLRDRTMPPKDADKPSAEANRAVVDWLARQLKSAPQAPIVRRMNRTEHENTLRDLLGLPGIEIKEMLPIDGDSQGFDTTANSLDISYVQMARYMDAADVALSRAAALGLFPEKPELKTIRYYPQHCGGWWHRSGEGATVQLAAAGPDTLWNKETGVVQKDVDPNKIPPVKAMGTFFHSDPAGLLYLNNHHLAKIPMAGMYRIKISTYAFHWTRGELVPCTSAEVFSLATQKQVLGYFDALPDKPSVSTVTTWLEPDDHLHFNAVTLRHGHGTDSGALKFDYQGVAVEWVDVEGPLLDEWPTGGKRLMFGDLPVEKWKDGDPLPRPARPQDCQHQPLYTVVSQDPQEDARRLLKSFMSAAVRRPVTDDEVQPFIALFQEKLTEPSSFEESLRLAQQAILSSAHFVFLSRETHKNDLHALAARLSYFLWSSAPDQQLNKLAADGSLARPDVLRTETERLLNDPKSRRFVENFTGQWLKLRDINSTQPDKQLYPEDMWESDVMPYTVDSMLEETRQFFAGMVREDLSVTHVIDSDFSYLNSAVARLYGMPDVYGAQLRKLPLHMGGGRGGIMTQPAVLKVSANGTTTSPVVRGVFVTSRLLGRSISPPPPNISGVDPDVRGATTIREQLAKHRSNATCSACHAKMDPPGFALETFDVVGMMRDRYRILKENRLNIEGPRIDPSGETAAGEPFDDVAGLKAHVLANPDQLARNLTVKLLTYATGRPPSPAELVEVDEIVARLREKKYGARSLIHEVVESQWFRGDRR
jgi:cytochrome c553